MTLAGIFICLVLAAPEPPNTWGLQLDGKPAKDLQEVKLADGSRVVFGHFETFGPTDAGVNGLVRLMPDGSRDPEFAQFPCTQGQSYVLGPTDYDVNGLWVFGDDTIAVAGGFHKCGDVPVRGGFSHDRTLVFLHSSGNFARLPCGATRIDAAHLEGDEIVVAGGMMNCGKKADDAVRTVNGLEFYRVSSNGVVANKRPQGVRVERIVADAFGANNGGIDIKGELMMGWVGTAGYFFTETQAWQLAGGVWPTPTDFVFVQQNEERPTITRGALLEPESNTTVSAKVEEISIRGVIHSVAIDSKDRILLGGSMRVGKKKGHVGLIRLRADGSLDQDFSMNFPAPLGDEVVRTIALQANGDILVGGRFMGFGASRARGLIRLSENGSVDAHFGRTLGGGFPNEVRVVAVQKDGKILVGGNFDTFQQERISASWHQRASERTPESVPGAVALIDKNGWLAIDWTRRINSSLGAAFSKFGGSHNDELRYDLGITSVTPSLDGSLVITVGCLHCDDVLYDVKLCQQERVLTFDSNGRLREKKAVYRARDIRCSLADP